MAISSKTGSGSRLFADAVRRVAAGGSALDPEIVALMVGRRRKGDPLEELTPRERQVLTLMAEGESNLGIAEALGVTLAAVEKHVSRLSRSSGCGTSRWSTGAFWPYSRSSGRADRRR